MSIESREPKMKRIDMQRNYFEAAGTTYFIQSGLSLARYTEYLKLTSDMTYNVDFTGLHKTLTKIFKASSSGNDLIAGIQLCRELSYNQINAIVDFASRDHPQALRYCALFINAEGEDTTVYDDRVVDLKIKDWTEEGYLIDDFFFLAANFIPKFRTAFSEQIGEEKVAQLKEQYLDADTTMTTSKKTSTQKEEEE